VISHRAKELTYLVGLVDAMLLVRGLFLALGVRSLVPVRHLKDGLPIDLGTHVSWLGIPPIAREKAGAR
jgi:hypothetical protein